MSTPEKPSDSKADDNGAGWYNKVQTGQNSIDNDWRSRLTVAEEEAMQAEADWARKATKYDWPGPKRFRIHITKSRRPT